MRKLTNQFFQSQGRDTSLVEEALAIAKVPPNPQNGWAYSEMVQVETLVHQLEHAKACDAEVVHLQEEEWRELKKRIESGLIRAPEYCPRLLDALRAIVEAPECCKAPQPVEPEEAEAG